MFSRTENSFLIFPLSYHVRVTPKMQVNFRCRRYLKVLIIVSYNFLKFFHYLCFRGQGIHFWYSYWATMLVWPRKSKSFSGTGGTWRYWWFCLMIFRNFWTIYVFDVREFISDIHTELPCLCDLENSSELPVQEVLESTDDFVLWISTISSVFMFSRSMNPLLTFPVSWYVCVTPKIQVNSRYMRYSTEGLLGRTATFAHTYRTQFQHKQLHNGLLESVCWDWKIDESRRNGYKTRGFRWWIRSTQSNPLAIQTWMSIWTQQSGVWSH